MSFGISPTHPQFLIHQELANKQLDYRASNEAWRATAEPFTHIMLESRLNTKREANESILETDNVITITAKDYPSTNFCYKCVDEDDDDDDPRANMISFAENDVRYEYADRHPTLGAPPIQTDNEDQKRFNSSLHAPITTTASKYMFSVVFAGGDEIVQLKASYRHQLNIRIDKESKCLYLDCFEYKPTCLDITDEDLFPTLGELNAYGNVIFYGNGRGDEDEGISDIVVTLEDAQADLMEHYKALVGKFLNSRVFRLGISLSNVQGIRLIAMPTDHRPSTQAPESDDDIAAVLILETSEALGANDFAVRTVRSKQNNADSFTFCPDWLPGNSTGSKTSRFYFYGSLAEMKSTAAHMAKLCPDIANMLEAKGSNTLALSPGVISVEYDSAPSHGVNNQSVNFNTGYISPLPPPSTWDGIIPNIREVFEATLEREENPAKRMMLRMMADPMSVAAVNQNENSSMEDMALSYFLTQQVIRDQGTDGIMDTAENGCA